MPRLEAASISITSMEEPAAISVQLVHTPQGAGLLANFLFGVAGLRADWSPASFIEEAVDSIRRTVGDQRVLR